MRVASISSTAIRLRGQSQSLVQGQARASLKTGDKPIGRPLVRYFDRVLRQAIDGGPETKLDRRGCPICFQSPVEPPHLAK